MLRSKRFYLTLALLLFAVITSVYYAREVTRLEQTATDERLLLQERTARLAVLSRLQTVDSLFHTGEYAAARTAYQELLADTSRLIDKELLNTRIGHAGQLIRFEDRLADLRRLAARRPAEAESLSPLSPPTVVNRMPLENSRPDQYDSLRFALQKAEMQVRNLQGQLRSSSGGNYLTFESRQGNEVYYVGDIKRGKANGRGVALLSSGSRYVGEWLDNQKHGTGEFHWPDGAYYEGEYANDQRSGRGTYHFPHGEVYVGEWEDDVRHGEGIFYDEKGEVMAQGEWKADELVEQK